MTDAAFTATFANVKNVPSRKTVQLVFELPVEQSKGALDILGGIPDPSVSVHVAIARLVVKPAAEKPERSASQRAWALCQSPRFGEWLCGTIDGPPTVERTVERLRADLGVKSRSELDTDPAARARFEQLEAEYKEASR